MKRTHTKRPGEWKGIGQNDGEKAIVARPPTCCATDAKAYRDGYESGKAKRLTLEHWQR